MTNTERLRQYIAKASFASAGDRYSALECLSEIERELDGKAKCQHCGGTGWMARDPDIGTDQECFVCEGSGTVRNDAQRLNSQAAPLLRCPVELRVSDFFGERHGNS